MLRLEAEEEVDRPPAQVFRFVASQHFENHPKWDPAVAELMATSPGEMREGSTARLVRVDRGKRVEGTMEVIEYEPDRAFAVISRFGPFTLHQRAVLRALSEDRTLLRLNINTDARGPTKLLLPLAKRRFQMTMNRSLRTIKRLVELE